MDIVDALTKIKKLEREIESLKSELKKANSEMKGMKTIENKLLKECEVLADRLARCSEFNDYDEIIYTSKPMR